MQKSSSFYDFLNSQIPFVITINHKAATEEAYKKANRKILKKERFEYTYKQKHTVPT